ncbi:MAG: 4a-hydroxytetrahydrobiopterin dehydratase [Proteobacteria bacterium]|nr:4a-hydroxytetrahydrobiopterin dehydratase [Pseudomonadota bacterium]
MPPKTTASASQPATTDLHEARCRPLKGPEHCLDAAHVKALLKQLPGWAVAGKGTAIEKTFGFDNYYQTLAFVNALAFIAHAQDHHPDLGVHYNRCVVRYSTHDVGGLSTNDFICAAKVERLAGG